MTLPAPKRDRLLAAIRSAGHGLTIADLADWTDSTPQAVRGLITWHREHFRIVGWIRQPRHLVAVWGEADGKRNARRPSPLSNNEKAAKYRASRRALIAAKARKAPRHPFEGLMR